MFLYYFILFFFDVVSGKIYKNIIKKNFGEENCRCVFIDVSHSISFFISTASAGVLDQF